MNETAAAENLDRVLSLYEVARRPGAHVDTLHLLCLREGVSIERDEQGVRCVLAADVGRLPPPPGPLAGPASIGAPESEEGMPMTIAERDALVRDNQGLAAYWARRYAGRLGFDDAMQEALLALVVAARRFDPDRLPAGRFGAYAALVVRRRLRRASDRTPRLLLDADLRRDDDDSDRSGVGAVAEPERPSGADVELSAWAVQWLMDRLGPVDREVLADYLVSLRRRKGAAPERPSACLAGVFERARAVAIAAWGAE